MPVPSGQEDQTQRWRDRQRHYHRYEHRYPVSEHQRLEESTREALQEKHRHDRNYVDQSSVGDRRSDLNRCLKHYGDHRFSSAFAAILAQSSHYILYVYDRVVYHHTDGDDEPRQDHHVDNRTELLEHEHGSKQRERNRDQADEGGAPLEQERCQNQDHQQNSQQQRLGEVAQSHFDEGRRTEDRSIYLHARKTRTHVVDSLFYAPRHIKRVGVGELLNDQHQAAAIVDYSVTDERLGIPPHVRHIIEAQILTVTSLQRHLGQVVGAHDGQNILHIEPLAALLYETSCPDHVTFRVAQQSGVKGVSCLVHHLLQRHTVLGKQLWIDLDVLLFELLTVDGHVSHAVNAQQLLPDLPVGDHGHLSHVQLIRGDPYLHDPAGGRQGRHHPGRAGQGRQIG